MRHLFRQVRDRGDLALALHASICCSCSSPPCATGLKTAIAKQGVAGARELFAALTRAAGCLFALHRECLAGLYSSCSQARSLVGGFDTPREHDGRNLLLGSSVMGPT